MSKTQAMNAIFLTSEGKSEVKNNQKKSTINIATTNSSRTNQRTSRLFKVARVAQYRDRVPFGLKLKSYTNIKRPVYKNIINYEDIELVRCPFCTRKFHIGATFLRHNDICKKVFIVRRPIFNSKAQRGPQAAIVQGMIKIR